MFSGISLLFRNSLYESRLDTSRYFKIVRINSSVIKLLFWIQKLWISMSSFG